MVCKAFSWVLREYKVVKAWSSAIKEIILDGLWLITLSFGGGSNCTESEVGEFLSLEVLGRPLGCEGSWRDFEDGEEGFAFLDVSH